MDSLRVDMNNLEDRLRTQVRQEIRDEGVITRRHVDVVAESLHDDVRSIAEGLVSLDAKVERMRRA